MSIGSTIRARREAAGLSGRDLAEKANVDANYLWRVEVGRSVPSATVLKKIADGLGCSMGDLLGEDPPTPLTPLQKRVLGMLEVVPQRRLPDWLAYAGRLAAEDQEAGEDFSIAAMTQPEPEPALAVGFDQ